MQLQIVSDGTFRKVRKNIDRLFDKNLTDLIRGIRNNKENEARYISNCMEEIKTELRQDSTFIKANAVEKLAYLQMLGYDISWASFNIIEVMASTKFCEKRIGYLAATQAFNDETDVLMLTTNLIRKDLQSSTNIYDIGVALNGLSCFVTPDLSRDLVNDIVNLVPYEPKLGRKLLEPLTNLINSTSAMSLLYECINTVIAILISISSEGPGDYTPSIQLCVQKLGVLIEDSDQNLVNFQMQNNIFLQKYLGLLAMGKILQTHPKAVQAHKDIVLRCLDDKDESIRLRALDLLYGMISKKNIMEIVRKLMEHLDAAEGSFYRDELLQRIVAICSHENYKYIINFEWYISVLVELTKVEGTKHGTLIAEQIQDVAVRVHSVRHFTVSQMVLLVQNAQLLLQGNNSHRKNMAEVLLAAAWICGEFAQHVNDITTLLESMLRLKLSVVPGALLSVYVQNMAKLYALQLCKLEADGDWDGVESLDNLLSSKLPEFQYTDHLEAQERACNLMALLKFAIEKHAERVKIGAMLAKCFEGELNPVAAKAQRKVPIPEGLDLDSWLNEPEPSSDEEENNWDIDESDTEEAVERVLSPEIKPTTTSHYGAENLPQHGRKHSIPGKSNREQSPLSYHRQGTGNGTTQSANKKKPKESAETTRKRREMEQERNPFYVKDNPKARPNLSNTTFPTASKQPEFLQSPLEISGVVGLERYLQQKDSTLSWKAVGKSKKKQRGKAETIEAAQTTTGKKGTKKHKKQRDPRADGQGTSTMGDDNKSSDEGEHADPAANNEVAGELFVYKGDGEMPEGATLSSSEEEQLKDEFQALDIELEAPTDVLHATKKRPSRDSVKKQRQNKDESEATQVGNGKKSKKVKKKKSHAGEESAQPGAEKEVKPKKKKALGKKASLRKEYASIDSPTGGNAEAGNTGQADEQLISLDDDAAPPIAPTTTTDADGAL